MSANITELTPAETNQLQALLEMCVSRLREATARMTESEREFDEAEAETRAVIERLRRGSRDVERND
jgi:flagellar motor switch protein FliM